MNDRFLFSTKKAEQSVDFHLTTIIEIIGGFTVFSLCLTHEFYHFILDEGFSFSFAYFFGLLSNGIALPIYIFFSFYIGLMIIPFIYDFWGTEMIYISDDYLTIEESALFLHKTKSVKISNIIRISYTGPRKLPEYSYLVHNAHKVKIKYYRKHRLLKRTLYCGMNFSVEEYTKFGTIMQELIDKSKINDETK